MINRVVKLLNLTRSTNDHEALSAIRNVNKLLEKNGSEWKDMVTIQGQRNNLYAKYCNAIMKKTRSQDVAQQVININNRVQAKGHLSKKDWTLIKELYERVVGKSKSAKG